MNCLCNCIHQRPVLGGSGRGPGGRPESFLPHLMSPASPLLGLRKEVDNPLKEETPFSSIPLLPLAGGGALGAWAGHAITAPARAG